MEGSPGYKYSDQTGHAWSQAVLILTQSLFVQLYTHRNALYDFSEIAGGIVGWEHAELCSRGRRKTFYRSFKLVVSKGINA